MKYLKYFRENFEWKELTIEDVFDCIKYQDTYRDLYPGYSEDQLFTEEYMFDTKEKAITYANEILNIFNNMPAVIDIYRTIYVKDEKNIDTEYPGDHWSFDKQSALDFGKNHVHGNYLFTGKIKAEDVEWKTTISNFIEMSQNYDGYDENELVVNGLKVFDLKYEKITKKIIEALEDNELADLNNNLKKIGFSVTRIQTKKVKISDRTTVLNRGERDVYRIIYNFAPTHFFNLVKYLYPVINKEAVKKLTWIGFKKNTNFLRQNKFIFMDSFYTNDKLLFELIDHITKLDMEISFNNIYNKNRTVIMDIDIRHLISSCIRYYIDNKVLTDEFILKLIVDFIIKRNDYSIFTRIKAHNKIFWKKIAPFVNGADNAAKMGSSGFSD